MLLLSLDNISAADGFGTVFLAALCGFGALSLIYAVLVVMNRVHEKNSKKAEEEKKTEETEKIEEEEEKE